MACNCKRSGRVIELIFIAFIFAAAGLLPTDFCFIGHNETYILQYEFHHL
jgi:hypothetical protein